jgi:sulfide dehydrogenase cytochrome subunit
MNARILRLALGATVLVSGLVSIGQSHGDQTTALCAGCHGPNGVSTDPNIPIIAGQSRTFIIYALKAFAAEVWPSTVMGEIAKGLNDEQIAAAAEFFSNQKMVRQRQAVDRDKAEEGARIHATLCGKCHIEGGREYDEYEAVLVGQWMPHLRKVLGQYLRGERAAEQMMLIKLSKLRPQDIDALVHYYGRGY